MTAWLLGTSIVIIKKMVWAFLSRAINRQVQTNAINGTDRKMLNFMASLILSRHYDDGIIKNDKTVQHMASFNFVLIHISWM
ncbi:hypothetical protein MNBD_GAMMA17-1095 [hydrothermal vent metagenome]|uniref:Uncharacterized protein n=1 Tax=hydrothermal vent metagenome TaxID=652676 RepID=A0A3B0YY28_9ZZZZ